MRPTRDTRCERRHHQGHGAAAEEAKENAKTEASSQCLKLTPYEFFRKEVSEEIPVCARGRMFRNGHDSASVRGRAGSDGVVSSGE